MRKQVEHWASSVQFRKPMDGPAPPLWSTKLHYGSFIQVDSDWELEWERLRMKQSLYRTPGLRKQNHSASVYNLWTNSLAALQQRVNSRVIAMRFTCSCDTQVPTWVRNQLQNLVHSFPLVFWKWQKFCVEFRYMHKTDMTVSFMIIGFVVPS